MLVSLISFPFYSVGKVNDFFLKKQAHGCFNALLHFLYSLLRTFNVSVWLPFL